MGNTTSHISNQQKSKLLDKRVILSWSTNSESNNYGFEVLRRIKGDYQWECIGFVKGDGTTVEKNNYSFIDQNPGYKYLQYQLKQLDFDGQYKFSEIRDISISVPNSFFLQQNYPNPFNSKTKISFGLPETSNIEISICNLLGERIHVFKGIEDAGYHSVNWEASENPSGMYIIVMQVGNIIHTRRCILLK